MKKAVRVFPELPFFAINGHNVDMRY